MQILVSGPSQLIKRWNTRFTSRNTEQQQSNTCLTCWCHESVPNTCLACWGHESVPNTCLTCWCHKSVPSLQKNSLYDRDSVNKWRVLICKLLKIQLSPSQNYFLLKTCTPSTIKLGIELPLDIRSLFLIFGIAEKILYVFN